MAELYLYAADGHEVATCSWQADRELAHYLLQKTNEFLQTNGASFETLKGLFVFQGPGSFTGLRIGLTVMNTLANALKVPIVAASGNAWCREGIDALMEGHDDRVVVPFYGAAARITTPKK